MRCASEISGRPDTRLRLILRLVVGRLDHLDHLRPTELLGGPIAADTWRVEHVGRLL